MLWLLRLLFLFILASMLAVTSWASWHGSLRQIPREVLSHPWFIATLVDAYAGFLTFYVWVAWKEGTLLARLLWLLAIGLLGNLAMASYVLIELFRLSSSGSVRDVLLRRSPGGWVVPALFVGTGVLIYCLA